MEYRARWIAPVDSPPIEHASIVVEHGRIVSVGRARSPSREAIDFGDAVIVPGFVNAHTHLEFTGAAGRVAYSGSFTDWIKRVIPLHPARISESAHRDAIRDGLGQSLGAGVVAVGDIGMGPVPREEWSQAPLHTVGFLEVNGMGPKLAVNPNLETVRSCCAEPEPQGPPPEAVPLHRLGISPHAPYSTDVPIYRETIELAARTQRPISTHLAETREEEQFLRDGTGPFRELLETFGLWDGTFQPPGCSPVEYAARMGLLACQPVLAHVNYPSDRDLDLLVGSGASVVYCPRSHAYFQHAPHRWRDMLARGINVCLGTDSLVSNQTLSILDEMRFIRAADASAPAGTLLKMATLNGAAALGLADEIGSLTPGKRADFVVIPLADAASRDPLADIMASSTAPTAVFMSGEQVQITEA
jgi:aminodeoxyfutalosine deaminase